EEIRPGVFYLDISRINDNDFRDALPKLEKARGIVFDFRGYPSGLSPTIIFQHLTDRAITSPQWHVPHVRRPDREGLEFQRRPGWVILPVKPRLTAPRSEEHTSELQSRENLVCRLLLEKKKKNTTL